jgi:hypothetical protein
MTIWPEGVETYGSTCPMPLCDWDSPERDTAGEAVDDYWEHMVERHPWASAKPVTKGVD